MPDFDEIRGSVNMRDFSNLPILTKEIIQNEGNRIHSQEISRMRIRPDQTGGSTGHMIFYYHDINSINHTAAGIKWTFRICGYRNGDKQVFLWGSDYDSKAHNTISGKLFDRLRNTLWINTFDLNKETLLKAAKKIEKWKPDFIWGYVSSLVLLAQIVQSTTTISIRPKAVQTTAEVLTSDQRKLIEETFNCKIFNRYGSREVGIIAHECEEQNGLHILTDNNHVEILTNSDQESANVGKIIVTNLNGYATPFIRYEIGDLGNLLEGDCPCGRNSPRLGRIVGRVADTIISPSGKLIHGEFFTHLFYKMRDVLQFKVVQETPRDLHIKIVPDKIFHPGTMEKLRGLILEHGDQDFNVEFEVCEKIPVSASGKYRFVESKVSLSL
jgi:phenylacetate-CoA ligase